MLSNYRLIPLMLDLLDINLDVLLLPQKEGWHLVCQIYIVAWNFTTETEYEYFYDSQVCFGACHIP